MLIPEIIRIYNELGTSKRLNELDTDQYLNGRSAYNIKVGDLLLEYRPGITISFESMETAQLRIYLNRTSSRWSLKTVMTVIGFTRKVYNDYHEILISKSNTFSKAIINSSNVPIRDYVCENVSDRSVSLWEMSEEELFQFSLVDLSFDMNIHDDVKKQVLQSYSVVPPGLSTMVSYDSTLLYHPDLSVLYEYTVPQ